MMTLVPFEAAHFPTLGSWFADEREAVQWGGPLVSHPVDAAQMNAMLRECLSHPPERRAWMTLLDGDIVGHAQVAFDWRNGIGRLSRIAIAPSARGRGLAVPMLALVLDQAFDDADIERVELNVYPFNTPALRSYERVGMKVEGVRRSSARVGGERWDTVMMAILRPEWQRLVEANPQ